MEELQDAIEDAQYMNAMRDETPKPTKPWKFGSPAEFEAYMTKLRTTKPEELEIENICSGSLGFYFFIKYVKEHGDPIKGDFLMECAKYRNTPAAKRNSTAYRIVVGYLTQSSTGYDKVPRDANLCRDIRKFSPEMIFWTDYINLPDGQNAIKAGGSILTEVLDRTGIPITHVRDPRQPQIDVSASFRSSQQLTNGIRSVDEGYAVEAPRDLFDKIDKAVFEYLKHKHLAEFQQSAHYTKLFQLLSLASKPVTEEDFSLFRVLGRGGFGLVNGCKRCTSGHLYAMKVMNKKRVKMKKAENLCLNERNILALIDSPFVVCMKYSFATANDLYIILDLMIGGDLGFHLSRNGRFTKKEALYYAARTLMGIATMHDHSIVYRDLKPENILMDEHGYTRISDLGLACRIGKLGLSGTCGTRGYWAPDMLRRDADGKRMRYFLSVDWFSFGCCLYEFLYGVSPFRTDKARNYGNFDRRNKADRDKAIDLATLEMEPDYDPLTFDEDSQNVISKLLIKDGNRRLGANGYKEIMQHAYFRTIDWDQISYQAPPIKSG